MESIYRGELLRTAASLARQGRVTDAIDRYEAAIAEDGDDWALRNLVGDLYATLGEGESAAAHFREAAELLAAQGFTAKALALYKKVLRLRANDDRALCRSAELAEEQGFKADADRLLLAAAAVRRSQGDERAARLLEARTGQQAGERLATDDGPASSLSPSVPLSTPEPQPPEIGVPSQLVPAEPEVPEFQQVADELLNDHPQHSWALPPRQPADLLKEWHADPHFALDTAAYSTASSGPDAANPDVNKLSQEAGSDAGTHSDHDVFLTEVRAAIFAEVRTEAEQALQRGIELLPAQPAIGLAALREAATALHVRHQAATRIGRFLFEDGNAAGALEWFARAMEAESGNPEADHALAYDIGRALEAQQEDARALAVFLELQREAGPSYRDVDRRVERLAGLIES